METGSLLSEFFRAIQNNPCIGPSHVSFYAALIELQKEKGYKEPIVIKRIEVMSMARIAGISTYHRLLKDLVAGGYIRYEARFDRKGSRVYL
ncbi:hypothetical protein [Pedobacter insulae]|uniref:Ferric uptake regulator family protein n=1 Tax=Pedobacter insulae TaxID=414048 RepID=A0A1I2ZJX8_9SPHI|nr:hypothetical protein [Pedobacter insulae]SFH38030.1 hypothetical protein SAMN04489864_11083 [Pedobacter insulae]